MTNPPTPSGYALMKQLAVTPAMTAWAVKILRDPQSSPMFSTATQAFNALTVLARVEWHAPDFQNHAVHRGVTLYAPTRANSESALAEGVDLSGYQPIVDWEKAAASGIAFAFVDRRDHVGRPCGSRCTGSKRSKQTCYAARTISFAPNKTR